ncbi:sugar phosphate isomerase/epimerase family protein [Paenibacillus sp. YPG26]|uniref:sugar phosphate isomerase/epimerase family protein n=1 Tax=Paenibacillus sp. YPG26 TaxID=2878915 RepID=UPI00203B97FC|nr:sugar phosphate isomerase/epimerase family protein [Paenibacillus sp. YPG26]USB31940.1 sugar phosphate isomerase/epimerase [Paenibacillus sp. YPG26]
MSNPESPRWKYSICSTGLKSMPLVEVLDAAKNLSQDGVELWSQHLEDFVGQGGSLEEARELLAARGLEVPAIASYTYLSKSAEDIGADLVQLERAAELAQGVGSPRIRTFAGHVPSAHAGVEEWNRTMQGLREASDRCAFAGIRLAVEIHNNTYADRLDRIKAIIQEAGPGKLELIYDPFNLFVDRQDPVPVLGELSPWISHVHFKNYIWDHRNWNLSKPVPVLQGDCDHQGLILELLEARYAGYISFEYFGDSSLSLASRSLAEIRTYLHHVLS